MRRSRRNRPHLSLSLFPFLAVLICTMGVLIVLLVIVVKHADSQAEQIKVAEAEQADTQAEEIAIQTDVASTRIELLDDLRAEATDDLHNKQQFRSNIQSQIDQLRKEAESLKARYERMQQLDQQLLAKSEAEHAAELKKLKTELDKATDELSAAKSVTHNVESSYAIVPYHGNGGTKQKPIFVECTGDAVILQPYGIRLTPEDFAPPVMAGNPLDVALLTIRDHMQKINNGSKIEQAYPLLIVRPNGAASYAMTRRAMKSWVDQFGYELIPAEMKIDFPEESPALRAEIEAAIQGARIRARSLRQATNRPPIGLDEIARNQFGSVRGDRGGTGNSNEYAQRQQTEINGNSGSFQSTTRTGNDGGHGNFSSDALANSSQYKASQRGSEGVANRNNSAQNNELAANGMTNLNRVPASNVSFREGNRLNGSFQPGQSDASQENQTVTSAPQSVLKKEGKAQWDYDRLKQAYRDGTYDPSTEGAPTGNSGDNTNTGSFVRSTAPVPMNSATAGDSSAGSNSFASQGSASQGSASQGSTAQGSAAQGSTSQSQSQQSDSQQGAPNLTLNQPKSLASTRGKDWALQDYTENGTLYRRQIYLDCDGEQLLFKKAADGNGPGEAIEFNSETARHVDELIHQVWRRVESWGMAGVQSYWRPQLMIRVAPEGVSRATEIQALLEDSGLDVELIRK